jgi:DNA-binding response OmpR family regulator
MDLIRRLDEKPEILILDHLLENCTGLEVLEIVKRKCGDSTYVIYLSAQDYLNVTLKALRSGAIEYVEKGKTPFNHLDSIISKISFHTDGFSKPMKLDQYRTDSKSYELTS